MLEAPWRSFRGGVFTCVPQLVPKIQEDWDPVSPIQHDDTNGGDNIISARPEQHGNCQGAGYQNRVNRCVPPRVDLLDDGVSGHAAIARESKPHSTHARDARKTAEPHSHSDYHRNE